MRNISDGRKSSALAGLPRDTRRASAHKKAKMDNMKAENGILNLIALCSYAIYSSAYPVEPSWTPGSIILRI